MVILLILRSWRGCCIDKYYIFSTDYKKIYYIIIFYMGQLNYINKIYYFKEYYP
ncbi:protein of unknown function [Tepidibacter aestuarii]|nr:protein of unknown function [Tepidibacter aestuarii]